MEETSHNGDIPMNSSMVTFHENKLSYSGQKCYRIPDALGKLYGSKVQCLDLSYNELVTLKGLEAFPQVEELILDNNQLSDSLTFPLLPYLHTLSLNKNLITDIEQLVVKISQNLRSISYLSLLGNQACPNQLTSLENDEADYQRYRYFVLHHLPNLKFLDSTRVREEERTEAKRRGQFMKVVRPKVNNLSEPDILQDSSSLHGYTPLPNTLRKFNEHKGAYGKCRYKYSGKHSEGNRFIHNNDL